MDTNILKTSYEWCLEANIRLLKLSDWDTDSNDYPFYEEAYYEEKIDAETFKSRISNCTVKPNSQPRKTEMFLEYRMYGLVPYNINQIQQAIQFGHAVVEYGQTVKGVGKIEKIYDKWANKDKTFIILNGGTTNNSETYVGTLNKHLQVFYDAGILVAPFYEPDLGNQLTAFVFLVDERVFNRTLYPDFVPETIPYSRKKPSEKQLVELEEKNTNNYKHWVEKIGGSKNAFLRDYLKPLKLA
jgi:hypothetical protein